MLVAGAEFALERFRVVFSRTAHEIEFGQTCFLTVASRRYQRQYIVVQTDQFFARVSLKCPAVIATCTDISYSMFTFRLIQYDRHFKSFFQNWVKPTLQY